MTGLVVVVAAPKAWCCHANSGDGSQTKCRHANPGIRRCHANQGGIQAVCCCAVALLTVLVPPGQPCQWVPLAGGHLLAPADG